MIRYYRPDLVHEVTMRTIDGRWWFDPSNISMRKEIVGALAVAQRETAVRVHGVVFMSNHYHGLFSADYPEQFSAFLCHFHAGVARIVNRHWGRRGRVWDGRAKVIPIFGNEESELQRLDYLLGQNVKAGAGAHPRDWTGVSTTDWLLGGAPLVGVHRDQTAITLAGRNGRDPGDLAKYMEEVAVELAPLPCFAGREESEWRSQVNNIADGIAERYGAAGGDAGASDVVAAGSVTVSAGRFEGVASDLPEAAERVRTSAHPPKTRVKPVHAAALADREALTAERAAFEQEYREAAEQQRIEAARAAAGQHGRQVLFPRWSFPARAPSWPLWLGVGGKSCDFEG